MEFKKEDDPLSAAIDYWLKNISSISWKTIVAAVKSDHVGETGLAETICEKYCHQKVPEIQNGKACSCFVEGLCLY